MDFLRLMKFKESRLLGWKYVHIECIYRFQMRWQKQLFRIKKQYNNLKKNEIFYLIG